MLVAKAVMNPVARYHVYMYIRGVGLFVTGSMSRNETAVSCRPVLCTFTLVINCIHYTKLCHCSIMSGLALGITVVKCIHCLYFSPTPATPTSVDRDTPSPPPPPRDTPPPPPGPSTEAEYSTVDSSKKPQNQGVSLHCWCC